MNRTWMWRRAVQWTHTLKACGSVILCNHYVGAVMSLCCVNQDRNLSTTLPKTWPLSVKKQHNQLVGIAHIAWSVATAARLFPDAEVGKGPRRCIPTWKICSGGMLSGWRRPAEKWVAVFVIGKGPRRWCSATHSDEVQERINGAILNHKCTSP